MCLPFTSSIIIFFGKHIIALCHVTYCYNLFVPGGRKYGHTQKDGCGCVILFHFIHKLDLWRMNCCCYHILYLKIPCLLDVSFFLKVTPVLTFSPAHFLNSINVEQCCYIVGNVFCSVCAVCDMQKFLLCTVLKFFACLKLHRAVFSKLFCLWNLTSLKKDGETSHQN